MKKIWFILMLACISVLSFADPVDMYGEEDRPKAQNIIQKYQKDIDALSLMKKEVFNNMQQPFLKKELHRLKQKIREQIQAEGDYTFVDIDQVYYPDKKKFYSTIEVVKKTQTDRFTFIPEQEAPFADLNHSKQQDIITSMITFQELVFHLTTQGKIPPYAPNCPFHHCFGSFDYPKLQPYLKKFQKAALSKTDKALIKATLKSDPDSERREAAALLVGHFAKAEEIIATLEPYVLDKDAGVRNNATRVLLVVLSKSPQLKLDIKPVMALLNSPDVMDRNKALFLIFYNLKTPQDKLFVLKKARFLLVNLLALNQPNNHNPAYFLLKTISGKQFTEWDIKAWKTWATEMG